MTQLTLTPDSISAVVGGLTGLLMSMVAALAHLQRTIQHEREERRRGRAARHAHDVWLTGRHRAGSRPPTPAPPDPDVDPIAALTDEDRAWLRAHGWTDP